MDVGALAHKDDIKLGAAAHDNATEILDGVRGLLAGDAGDNALAPTPIGEPGANDEVLPGRGYGGKAEGDDFAGRWRGGGDDVITSHSFYFSVAVVVKSRRRH